MKYNFTQRVIAAILLLTLLLPFAEAFGMYNRIVAEVATDEIIVGREPTQN